jgi:hypothetical protein
MLNNNSFEFWLNYYKVDFKNECGLMGNDYILELNKWLLNHKKSYENRTDKSNTDRVIQDSINGQLNQIKAIETILKSSLSNDIKIKSVHGAMWKFKIILKRSKIHLGIVDKNLNDCINDKQSKEIINHYKELKAKAESDIGLYESICSKLKELLSNSDIDTCFKYAVSINK